MSASFSFSYSSSVFCSSLFSSVCYFFLSIKILEGWKNKGKFYNFMYFLVRKLFGDKDFFVHKVLSEDFWSGFELYVVPVEFDLGVGFQEIEKY